MVYCGWIYLHAFLLCRLVEIAVALVSREEFDSLCRTCLSKSPVGSAFSQAILKRLLFGIVSVESGFNPFAGRYEKNYKWTVDESFRPPGCSAETELVWQKTSWGLTQIMGATAREAGFRGWLSELVVPQVNLEVSIRHLSRLGAKLDWVEKDMISAWNAGFPRLGLDGRYTNQGYVDSVLRAIRDSQTT